MTREQFAELRRGQRLVDRQGRAWLLTADARDEDRLATVYMRSGDLVRRVNEREAGQYNWPPDPNAPHIIETTLGEVELGDPQR